MPEFVRTVPSGGEDVTPVAHGTRPVDEGPGRADQAHGRPLGRGGRCQIPTGRRAHGDPEQRAHDLDPRHAAVLLGYAAPPRRPHPAHRRRSPPRRFPADDHRLDPDPASLFEAVESDLVVATALASGARNQATSGRGRSLAAQARSVAPAQVEVLAPTPTVRARRGRLGTVRADAEAGGCPGRRDLVAVEGGCEGDCEVRGQGGGEDPPRRPTRSPGTRWRSGGRGSERPRPPPGRRSRAGAGPPVRRRHPRGSISSPRRYRQATAVRATRRIVLLSVVGSILIVARRSGSRTPGADGLAPGADRRACARAGPPESDRDLRLGDSGRRGHRHRVGSADHAPRVPAAVRCRGPVALGLDRLADPADGADAGTVRRPADRHDRCGGRRPRPSRADAVARQAQGRSDVLRGAQSRHLR